MVIDEKNMTERSEGPDEIFRYAADRLIVAGTIRIDPERAPRHYQKPVK
jgi:hypothetical protein